MVDHKGDSSPKAGEEYNSALARGEDSPPEYASGQVQDEQAFKFSESRKIGVTGAVFLILNKMIGTGSEYSCPEMCHSGDVIDRKQSSQHPPASSHPQAPSG